MDTVKHVLEIIEKGEILVKQMEINKNRYKKAI